MLLPDFCTITSNTYLDNSYSALWEGKSYTRREIMDAFVYGNLAHADEDRKTTYDSWRRFGEFFSLNEVAFVETITRVIQVIAWMKKINEQVLAQIETKDTPAKDNG